MPKFKPYNYDQSAMVVINYHDQLQPDTFEYAIHHLIEHKLDLSIFFPKYHNDHTRRPAYDPAILLKIVLFAYSKGICHEQGLLGNEMFAIDGCKMPSNAAKEWSGTFKELTEKRDKLRRQIRYHLREHQQNDSNACRDE